MCASSSSFELLQINEKYKKGNKDQQCDLTKRLTFSQHCTIKCFQQDEVGGRCIKNGYTTIRGHSKTTIFLRIFT